MNAPALAVLTTIASTAGAVGQTVSSWIDPVSGNWTDASRWTSNPFYPNNGSPPGATYRAVIDAMGSPYTVDLADSVTVSGLSLASPDATFRAAAGSVSLGTFAQAGGTSQFAGAHVDIPRFGTISDGQVHLSAGQLRSQPVNQFMLHGSGATFEQTGGTHELQITRDYRGLTARGGGAYRMSGGTLVISTDRPDYAGQSFIGVDGAGTFHQSGGLTTLQPNTPLFIGSLGDFPPLAGLGTFIVEGPATEFAGTFSMKQQTWRDTVFGIGSSGFGHGIVRDGAQADLGYMQVGTNRGAGTFAIESGAEVDVAGMSVGYGRWAVGGIFGPYFGTGLVTVGGAGSRLTIGAGTVNLGTLTGGSGQLHLIDGTTTVAAPAPVLTGNDARFTIYAGGRLDLDAGSFDCARAMLLINGRVTLAAGNARIASLRAESDATITLGGGRIDIGPIELVNSRLHIVPGSSVVPRVSGISLSGTALVDLADGGIVVDYAGPSPAPNVRALIIAGYNGGAWDGAGIHSSVAAAQPEFGLGYAESSELFSSFPATFGGWEVDDSAVLVRLTRLGDANLDGVVNLVDFNRLAAHFGTSSDALWSMGDFNYDGFVNLEDFNRLAANFGLSAGPDGVVDPEDWAALASAVPEPGVFLGISAGISLLLGRRRR